MKIKLALLNYKVCNCSCVLCSPGCFSLFRGKALMDDNVMAKYTTVSTEPRQALF